MYPTLPASSPYYIVVNVVDPCYNTGITPTGSFSTTYTIGATLVPYNFGTFTATLNSNNCGSITAAIHFTSSVTSQSSIITYPSATLGYAGFDIYSNSIADAGTITFYITATLSEYSSYPAYSINVYFTVNVINPCPNAIYT